MASPARKHKSLWAFRGPRARCYGHPREALGAGWSRDAVAGSVANSAQCQHLPELGSGCRSSRHPNVLWRLHASSGPRHGQCAQAHWAGDVGGIRPHFAEVVIGLGTTVAGVWLGYILAVKQDVAKLQVDQDARTREHRNEEEAMARSVLQEFKANATLAEENLEFLRGELRVLRQRTYKWFPCNQLYEGAGPSLYRNMPQVC